MPCQGWRVDLVESVSCSSCIVKDPPWSWLLSLILLKGDTGADQCWSRDRLQVERSVRKSLIAACGKTRLVPCKKVAKVAERGANGCRREIFSILEGLRVF